MTLDLLKRSENGAPLSATQHDANLTAIENAFNGISVADRTAMAALNTSTGGYAFLKEAGREGWFKWDSSNLSAQVTADTQQGLYVAPASAPTGATGAWVRVYEGPANALWFGADATGVADSAAAFNGMVSILADGAEAAIPRGTYLVNSAVSQTTKSIKWVSDFGAVFSSTSAANLFRDRAAFADATAGYSSNRVIVDGTVASGTSFGTGWNYRVGNTGAVASYQKDATYLTAITEDVSTGTGNGGSGADVNKDVVALDARGVIASGNTAGRAWGGNFYGQIRPGGEGQITGIEINIANNGSDVSNPDSAPFRKSGLQIVTTAGSGTAAVRLGPGTGTGWYKGLWSKQDALVNDANTSFVELQDYFRVKRDGYTTIGKSTSNTDASGIEIDPVGQIYISKAAANAVLNGRRGDTLGGASTVFRMNAQGKNSAGTALNYGSVIFNATDPTAASEDSAIEFHTYDAGTLANRLTVGSNVVASQVYTLIGKLASDANASGIELDPVGQIYVSKAAANAVINGRRGDTLSGAATVFTLNAQGKNNAGTALNYGRLIFNATDPTAASEDSALEIHGYVAGTLANRLTVGQNVTATGNLSAANLSGTNTGDQNLFSTIAVSGQSDVVADSATDTLTLVAGTGISITTNSSTDSVTITNTTSAASGLSRGAVEIYRSGAFF